MRVWEALSLALLTAMALGVIPDYTMFNECLFKVNHIIARVIIVFHQSQRLGWLKFRFLSVWWWNAVFLISAELLLGLIDHFGIYIWWLMLRNRQRGECTLPVPHIRLLEAGIAPGHWNGKIVDQFRLGRLLVIRSIRLYQESCLLKIWLLRFFLDFLFLLLLLSFFLTLFSLIWELEQSCI